jgi:hypothetical protein
MKTKSATAGKKDSFKRFNARYHLKILKALLISTNLFVLFMYASLFFIFADMPFNLMDELKVMANSLGWATGFGIAFSFILFAADGIMCWIHNRKRVKYPTISSAGHHYPPPTPLILKRSSPMIGREFSSN